MTQKTYQLAEPLHCGACALKIEGTLRKIEGVKDYDISFRDAWFSVDFNEELVTEDFIQRRIQELGYEIESVK